MAKLNIMSTIYVNNSMELKTYFENDIVLRNRGCPTTMENLIDKINVILDNNKIITLQNFEILYDATIEINDYNNELRPLCGTFLY